jgi:NitT/TauT family transport system substrate-binding protein
MKPQLKRLLTFTYVIFLLAFTGSISSAQVVRVAYSAISTSSILLTLTQESGFFRSEGLTVEVLYIQGGSLLAQGLISGEILISTQGGPAVVQAGLAGADLVFIGSVTNGIVDALVARTIDNAQQLKGKKIGITRYGSALDFLARLYIRRLGLNPEKDVTFIQSGGAPERFTALKAGIVDAAILNPELTRLASNLGFNILLNRDQMARIPWQHTGIVTSRNHIRSQRATMKRLTRALVKGIHRMRTDEAFTIKALARFLRQQDQNILKATYDEYIRLIPWPPYPSADGINVVLKELGPRARGKHGSDFIDPSLLDELEKEGLFKDLK